MLGQIYDGSSFQCTLLLHLQLHGADSRIETGGVWFKLTSNRLLLCYLACFLHPCQRTRLVFASVDWQASHDYFFRFLLRSCIHLCWTLRDASFLKLTPLDGYWLGARRYLYGFHDDSGSSRNGWVYNPALPRIRARRKRHFKRTIQCFPWLWSSYRTSIWLFRHWGSWIPLDFRHSRHHLLRICSSLRLDCRRYWSLQ